MFIKHHHSTFHSFIIICMMLQGIILIIVLTFHYINLNNIILALITLIGFYVGVKHIAMLVWFNFLYDLTF